MSDPTAGAERNQAHSDSGGRRIPTHHELIRLTVIASIVVYVIVGCLSLWFFDGLRLTTFLLVSVPAMVALLIAIPQLSWNRDHFHARLFFAQAPTDNIKMYAQSGLGAAVADSEFRTAVSHLSSGLATSDIPTASWLRWTAQVEKALPARWDIALDLVLLVSGALIGNSFTAIWSGGGDWSWSSLNAGDVLKLLFGLTLGVSVGFSQLRAERSHEKFRRRVELSAAANPAAHLRRLPFDDPTFAQRFHEDAWRVTHALHTPTPILRSLASMNGIDLDAGRDSRIASLTDLGFKFWQFGMGLILGVITSLF